MNLRAPLSALATLALAACLSVPQSTGAPVSGGSAQIALPPMRLFGPGSPAPAMRSNADMAQDFLDLSFRLESGQELDGFSRFTGPMTLRLTGKIPPTVPHDLAALLARLGGEAGLSLIQTTNADAAITIEFLPRRQLQARAPDAACFVAPRVGSWSEYRRASRATLDWGDFQNRDHLAIFIPSDTSAQEIRDCLHEELAQALGPLNDLFRLPDSVFNDDNIQSVLTGFDMLMLRVTYAPELQPGMSQGAVAAALPAILARLNPAGQRPGSPLPPTPRAYGDAIARALGHGTSAAGRRAAAAEALAIAEPWQDHRTGFAWLALGRLSGHEQKADALYAFQTADQLFRARGLPLYAAHADMQLAAFALAQGHWGAAIGLADAALPAATAAQNAALMSALMLTKAEALDHMGQAETARRLRLDSLAWARYGMASDTEVRQRLETLAALADKSDNTTP